MATAVQETQKDHKFLPQGEYFVVHVNDVVVDKGFNNRRDLGDMTELTESIKTHGVLQPLLVHLPKGSNMLYHLIAGERRLAAAKKAGLTIVPVILKELDDRGRLEVLIIENLQRKDIDALEEAAGYKRLIDLGMKQADIATKVGRSEAHVSKRLALVNLSAEGSRLVVSGGISLDRAIDLAKVKPELQSAVIQYEKKHQFGDRDMFRYSTPASVAKKITEQQEKDARRKLSRAQAKKEGATLIKTFGYGYYGRTERPLGTGREQVKVSLTAHRTFKCHRAYIDGEGRLKYACADPTSHMTKEEAKAFKRQSNPNDGYERQQAARKARQEQLQVIGRSRDEVVTAALPKLDPASARKLALETLVILDTNWHGVPEHILGLVGEKVPPRGGDTALAAYCNKSEANLLRVAVAVSYLSAVRTLETDQTYNAGQYLAAAEWLGSIGYKLTDLETAFLARVRKDLKVK